MFVPSTDQARLPGIEPGKPRHRRTGVANSKPRNEPPPLDYSRTHTEEEIAAVLGCSRQRVVQILDDVLRKLHVPDEGAEEPPDALLLEEHLRRAELFRDVVDKLYPDV